MHLPQLPNKPTEVIKTMQKKGFECYIVGGSVRNLLMHRPTHNWDFTTNAIPEQILEVFKDNSFYNNQFGTVGVKIQEDDQENVYEITTYRSEGGYTDRRHPDIVTWGKSLKDDLARRDFTINAIAYDGKTLVDPYHGQEDIEKKMVRAVGEPAKRFEEDALRLIRAVRIATELGFLIEEKTADAIKKQAKLIHDVAYERIRDELFKILASNHPADGILLLKQHNLLYEILPEFEKAFGTEQKSPERHHIYDVGTHLIESLRNMPSKDIIVRLATLLHDIGKPETADITKEGIRTFYNHEIIGATMVKAIAERLRLSRHDTGHLIRLVRWHQFSVEEHQTDSAVRRFIRHIGRENIQAMLDLRTGDRLGGGVAETSWRTELFKKRLEEVQKQPFSITDLKINGNDVMKVLNIKPGPKVGEVLQQLFAEVEEKKLENKRETLLERVRVSKDRPVQDGP